MARNIKSLSSSELGRAIRYAQQLYDEGSTRPDAVGAIVRKFGITHESAKRLLDAATRKLY